MSRFFALAVVLAAGPAFAQPSFPVPKSIPPDDATLKLIETKRGELAKALDALPKSTPDNVRIEVEVYAKAAEWIVRHGEWFTKDSGKQTLTVLDAGLARAKAVAMGQTPWRDTRNKPVVRAYRSAVDGSIQPYSLTLPEGYGEKGKLWRLDVVLHGRDSTITEVKFLAQRETAKSGKPVDYIVLEPYGRGNNAFRWAGESDVTEGIIAVGTQPELPVDPRRIVLRGFSMGGAGSWHIGLHRPSEFAVIGPGAGFSTTRGYIKNLPAQLPDYQEKCLHIYDAVDYAENAFNVPVVAYSGSKDAQKAAADNIENALKCFPLPLRFTHLIAPGLEHQMPAEWQAKAQTEYAKYVGPGRVRYPNHVRFVTYTTRYSQTDGVQVLALDEHYTKAVVDAKWNKDGTLTVTTQNVRALKLRARPGQPFPLKVTIDGQSLDTAKQTNTVDKYRIFEKKTGKWAFDPDGVNYAASLRTLSKRPGLQGPIDDAFQDSFTVEGEATTGYPGTAYKRFAAEWDKFFRGRLPTTESASGKNLVLFGTPQTNPSIAKILPKLPITWTTDKLVVNGVEYDAKTHVPVLIYPNPLNPSKYVVINSGHTFHATEIQGTNAQLYPRLGDWAVLKPTPTDKDPTAAEVVAAGLFDEFWQFPKK